jgi:small subunit ribosomal protein S6
MKFKFEFVFQNELFTILKRTALSIFDKGGIIRKIDNLGKQPLPYKVKALGKEAK